MKKNLKVIGLTAYLAAVALIIALMVYPEFMTSKTKPMFLQLFNAIEIGDSEQTVIAKSEPLVNTGWLRRYARHHEHDYRSRIFTDDRYLDVQFANSVVVFVGIRSVDVMTNKPPDAPDWKKK